MDRMDPRCQHYSVAPVRRPRGPQNRMDNPAALMQLDSLLFGMTDRHFVKAMEHIESIAFRRLENKNAQDSGFMRLPPEIRDYIIELSMPEDTFVFEGSGSEDSDDEDLLLDETWGFREIEEVDDAAARTCAVRGPQVPSLMHTSRQLRRETAAIYYARTAFVEDTGSLGKWLRQVPGSHKGLIRNTYSLNWRFNLRAAIMAAQDTDNEYCLRPGTSWIPWRRSSGSGPWYANYEITLVNYSGDLKDAKGIPEIQSRWGSDESEHRGNNGADGRPLVKREEQLPPFRDVLGIH